MNITIQGRTAEENCQQLEQLLETKVNRWASQHASVFAPEKFVLMHFTKAKDKPTTAPINVSGIETKPADKMRILGLWLDPELNYKAHIDHIKGTAGKRLNCLQSLCGST